MAGLGRLRRILAESRRPFGNRDLYWRVNHISGQQGAPSATVDCDHAVARRVPGYRLDSYARGEFVPITDQLRLAGLHDWQHTVGE